VSAYLLTGGGDWERYTFRGACNEPQPSNWQNACRRWAGHSGAHHTWSPRTGMDRRRHPYPAVDMTGRRREMVIAWGKPDGRIRDVWMLGRRAYVAPLRTDAEMVAAIKKREIPR
jgi:hypothetical protein